MNTLLSSLGDRIWRLLFGSTLAVVPYHIHLYRHVFVDFTGNTHSLSVYISTCLRSGLPVLVS